MANNAIKSFEEGVKEFGFLEFKSMCASWGAEQKQAYADGLLPSGEIQFWENSPGWSWEIDPVIDFEDLPFEEQTAILENNMWMEEQRLAYRDGKLSKEEILMLEEFETWTWDLDTDNLLRDM